MTPRRGRQFFTRLALALMTLALTLPSWSQRAVDAGAGTIALTPPVSSISGGVGPAFGAREGEHAPTASLPTMMTTQEGGAQFCLKESAGSPFSLGRKVPDSVAVGDFNLDGKPDVATANDDSVSVLLGNGAGGFTQAAGSPIDVDGNPESIMVGDLNLDGKPDLAMATPEYEDENVTVLIGDGTGGFTEPRESPFDAGDRVPQSIAIGDLNSDGKPDLAVAETFSALVVLLGDGTGNFTLGAGSPFPAGQEPNAVVIADFNLDQKPDLATANSSSNDVTVLLGNGAGGFAQAAGSPIGVFSSPQSAAVGDFNRDGKPDLAVVNNTNTTLLLGDGAGRFTLSSGSPFTGGGNWVAVADFNLDDKPDLAASALPNQSQGGTSILLGDGAGGFTQPAGSPFGGGYPLGVTVGDFNLDKKPDVTFADGYDVRVLLNSSDCVPTPPPTPTPLKLTASAATRAAGSPAANSQIATASGGEDPLNTLTVTVNGAASATADGVTVANLAINAAGAVTANVVADCAATNASFTLRVTESKGQFAEATLAVGVTPDDIAPVITACATDKTFTADAACQAVIPDLRGEVAATDNCTASSALTITQSPAPGTLVGPGPTTVTITVKDAANNTASCRASVTVERGDACAALNPPVVNGDGTPKNGAWALRPDPSLDPTGQFRAGRVRALPPTRALDDFYNAAQPIIADFSSAQIDETALFNFQYLGGDAPQGPLPFILSGQYPLNLTVNSNTPSSILFADANGNTVTNKFGFDPLKIVDLGNQNVELQARPNLITGGPYEGFWLDNNSWFNWFSKPASAPYAVTKLLFRFFQFGDPDGTQINLDEGEVALYQGCNYGGKATIFAADSPDFSALTSDFITLDKTTASVKLGRNTALTLYSGRDFDGASQFIETDTPCLDGTDLGRNTTSIKIRSLVSTLLETNSCVNCDLRGVDLSGKNLTGVNLAGANLSGATLTGANLSNAASLVGTKFDGATLDCVNFSGTAVRPVDLTQTSFQNATFTQDFSCRANFSYTRLDTAEIESQLRYFDLSHATVVFRNGVENLDMSNALLVGASIQGATIPGVNLTGANLTGANLAGTQISSDQTPGANLQKAMLDGVTGLAGTYLGKVVFSGASLKGVDLSRATLTDAQLDGANLTGANLTGVALQTVNLQKAILDGVIGFAGANLSQVVLNGTSLLGVNFSQAILNGTQLNEANLTGSNLTGVSLSTASLTGAILDKVSGLAGSDQSQVVLSGVSLRQVDLSNAKLYGAKLNGANLEGSNLSGAFLTNLPAGSSWNFIGETGISGNGSGFTVGNPAAPEGRQVAFIQSGDEKPSTISQTIILPQAGQVQVKVQVAQRGAEGGGAQDFEVLIDNTSLGVLKPSGTNYAELTTQSASVTAGTHTLELRGKNTAGGDNTAFIDEVRVEVVNGNTTTPVNVSNFGFEGPALGDGQFQYNPVFTIPEAASLTGARLKNVNLANAQLSGANFTNANFHGSTALGEKTCDINAQGFTQGCATAAKATMNNTQFAGAYLYGVDFSNTTVQGVQFGNAVLIGANFAGAKLSTDPTVGTESGFTDAFLQGANLAPATLTGTSLDGAFVDFRITGNDMYLRLDGNHTTFAGWQTPGQAVCLLVFYTGPTTVPTTNTTLTCPDGTAAGTQGCGPTGASNTRWKSPVEIDQTNPPGSYLEDATYTKKATPICSPSNSDW